MSAPRRLRVVVCGTTFGQFYLEGLSRPDSGMELAGIVARGSDASRACARAYGIPLFTGAGELHDIDLACVVVRAGILGGEGTELATALMQRGIHVLQEHPVHHAELVECLRTARRHGVGYRLNAFYAHLEPVRQFVAAARALVRQTPARFVDAVCGFQLVYSTLDILAEALGGVRPWRLDAAPSEGVSGAPFRSLSGVFAGVPITLRVQNQLDPGDPDNFAHIMHRITVGTDGGNVMLASTNGPTLWSPRLHVRREARTAPSLRDGINDAIVRAPAVVTLGPQQTPTWDELFRSTWPAAAGRAAAAFGEAITAGEDLLQRGQRDLTLCSLAEEVSAQLGPPELVHGERPPPVAAELLGAAFCEPVFGGVS
jgi:pyochelin biosynthetic protein PchG